MSGLPVWFYAPVLAVIDQGVHMVSGEVMPLQIDDADHAWHLQKHGR